MPHALDVQLRQSAPIPLDVAFTCGADDVVAIFGPSGSGKTTILRSIAGLHRPSHAVVTADGQAWIDTERGVYVPPHHRDVGLVFQDYALFPHLTAAENVQLALSHASGPERQGSAHAVLERVRLADLGSRRPHELSGGERQRVALARALARDPRVLLLDEPFSAVDQATRRGLRDEVDQIRRLLRVPTVLVTHDVDDVIRLATHLVVLDAGRAVAQGPLVSLLSRPDLRTIRDALGLGSLVETTVSRVDRSRGLATLAFEGGELVAPDTGLTAGDQIRVRIPAREVILSDRVPQGLSLHNAIRGSVAAVVGESGSPYVTVQLQVHQTAILAEVTRDAIERLGVTVGSEIYALVKSVALEV